MLPERCNRAVIVCKEVTMYGRVWDRMADAFAFRRVIIVALSFPANIHDDTFTLVGCRRDAYGLVQALLPLQQY